MIYIVSVQLLLHSERDLVTTTVAINIPGSQFLSSPGFAVPLLRPQFAICLVLPQLLPVCWQSASRVHFVFSYYFSQISLNVKS